MPRGSNPKSRANLRQYQQIAATPGLRIVGRPEDALPAQARADFRKQVAALMRGRPEEDRHLVERYAALKILLISAQAGLAKGSVKNIRGVKELSSAVLSLEQELELTPRSRRIAGRPDEEGALETFRKAMVNVMRLWADRQKYWDIERAHPQFWDEDKDASYYASETPPSDYIPIPPEWRQSFEDKQRMVITSASAEHASKDDVDIELA